MAKNKSKSKVTIIVFCILALILGFIGGGIGFTYSNLPYNEELLVGEETFYSYNILALS